MPKHPEKEDDISIKYQKSFKKIVTAPLTTEGIDNYGETALNALIDLIDQIKTDPHYSWTFVVNESLTQEQEDEIVSAAMGTDVKTALDKIISIQTDINRLDKYLEDRRDNHSPNVYVPPIEGNTEVVSGAGGGLNKEWRPKAKTALFILEHDFEINIDDIEMFSMITGAVTNDMMRSTGYDVMIAPTINRLILSCDEIGNNTFIFDVEQLEKMGCTIERIQNSTKAELQQLISECPNVGQSLRYSSNYPDRLRNAIDSPQTQNISEVDTPQKQNYLQANNTESVPYAPDGWYTQKYIAKKLGISPPTLNKCIKSSAILPRRYKDRSERVFPHYNLNEVQQIPELQEFIAIPYAPDGWYTRDYIAKKLGISYQTLGNYIDNSKIPSRRYKDSSGKIAPHYNLNEVQQIPELQEFIAVPYAPDGWCTQRYIAKKLGISSLTLNKCIKSSAILPRRYKDSSGKIVPHYNLNEVQQIPELAIPYAPDGWCTQDYIAKKLGISPLTLNKCIKSSAIPSRRYKNRLGRIFPHYNLNEVQRIPELQEFIKR